MMLLHLISIDKSQCLDWCYGNSSIQWGCPYAWWPHSPDPISINFYLYR